MWYISFRGEGDGGVDNIRVYHNNGKPHPQPNLLPTGGSNPALSVLRGFLVKGKLLYVANAYKKSSQILVYQEEKDGSYTFKEIFTSEEAVNSILHPYDLTFDKKGNCYISNQDTNVVTRLQSDGTPLPVASYLGQQYPPPDEFLAGTFVASSVGALPNVPAPAPPDVPLPQGLKVKFKNKTDKSTGKTEKKVANSVRGVLFYDGYLYVADEPGDAVKVYDGKTGELSGQIAGDNLSAPVQLLLDEKKSTLYIGSTGTKSVVKYDLSQGAPTATVKPKKFINGEVKHVSGMAFDADGNFYAAERAAKCIKKFDSKGNYLEHFIKDLPDEPEFILYVPKKSR